LIGNIEGVENVHKVKAESSAFHEKIVSWFICLCNLVEIYCSIPESVSTRTFVC